MKLVYRDSSLENELTTQTLTSEESTAAISKTGLFSSAATLDGYIIMVIIVLTIVLVATNRFKSSKKSVEEEHFSTVTI